ncbi:hypothetical protein [Diaphorobacter sp.]|uniref:hypothetical protein n=1 Tax=Diaphorobacter sp. TaxID=1934310 RepID=UPI0028B0D0A9|nr:hypothetical protein [Diaphorobacter sp.]
MSQTLIVALIIACAALYLLWRYMPQKWRNPLGKINPNLAKASGCGAGCSSCDSASSASSSCSSGQPLDAQDSRPIVFRAKPGDQ